MNPFNSGVFGLKLCDDPPVSVVLFHAHRSVLMPRITSHESKGERIAPTAFCRNPIRCCILGIPRNDDSSNAVAVSIQILGRRDARRKSAPNSIGRMK
jgi:hypothetical protein